MADTLLPEAISRHLGRYQQIFILPFDALGAVPFAILPVGDRMLIDVAALSVISSIRELDFSAGGQPDDRLKARNALIVGNPDSNDPDWVLPPLPGAEREAVQVASLLSAKPLLGKAATKERVMARIEQSDIAYFAAHAVSDAGQPLDRGFLALTGGRLTPRELQSRNLKRTKLVVLSACQTGLGQPHDVGILGLARAFILAGVPRVLMSLWNVDDNATEELMTRFVAYAKTESTPMALRRAMLDVRSLRPDPLFWASFAVFGRP